MGLLNRINQIRRLENRRGKRSPKTGSDRRFPQAGKPIKMIDQFSDGSLFTSGSRSREPITESISELEKSFSLIIVKLNKKKPDDPPA